MSQKEFTDILGHQEVSEFSIGNLSKLAGLARQAYEQKRTKECLDLTRAILLIDPENADAQWMRSSVQSQIHQDLENARQFLLQAQSRDNSEAEAVPTPVPPETQPDSEHIHGEMVGREGIDSGVGQEILRLVPASSVTKGAKIPWVWIACALVVLGLASGALIKVIVKSARAQSLQKAGVPYGATVAKANTPEPALPPTPDAEDPVPVPGPLPAAAGLLPTAERRSEADKSGLLPSDLILTVTVPNQQLPAVAGAKGTLAVSSTTSVDIYEGDQYLGSSPVSLELSAGMHTLEYRHGNSRKTVTQAIYANETARAMVTFDATVQINSKPWAEVFLDGVEQKDLGQTPLSGVRVPIGSVLIFQNPKFQPKKYRVTGTETGIQIVFP